MSCGFSYDHYEEILIKIKEKGYVPTFFHEEMEGKQIIMRHDVDQSLVHAYETAKIEYRQGIKATYYIWLNAPFYNIFEKESIMIINDMIRMGHEIGLHFDETCYEIESEEMLNDLIEKEASLINAYYGIEIRSVSFHRPSKYVLDNDLKLRKFINTYGKKYFNDFKYVSDSRGIWREGCVCHLIDSMKYEKLQVLIHPVWWGKESLNSQDKIEKFAEYKTDKLYKDLGNNISVFKIPDMKG